VLHSLGPSISPLPVCSNTLPPPRRSSELSNSYTCSTASDILPLETLSSLPFLQNWPHIAITSCSPPSRSKGKGKNLTSHARITRTEQSEHATNSQTKEIGSTYSLVHAPMQLLQLCSCVLIFHCCFCGMCDAKKTHKCITPVLALLRKTCGLQGNK
jgi:hypothetical protein